MNHQLQLPASTYDGLTPAQQGAGDAKVFVSVIVVLAAIIAWGLIVEPLLKMRRRNHG